MITNIIKKTNLACFIKQNNKLVELFMFIASFITLTAIIVCLFNMNSSLIKKICLLTLFIYSIIIWIYEKCLKIIKKDM